MAHTTTTLHRLFHVTLANGTPPSPVTIPNMECHGMRFPIEFTIDGWKTDHASTTTFGKGQVWHGAIPIAVFRTTFILMPLLQWQMRNSVWVVVGGMVRG
jgi:hypothetical protein